MSALATSVRAATAGAALVGRRRARADAGLLAFSAVVLAVSVALSLAVPRLVAGAADDAVQQSVRDAGRSADLVALIRPLRSFTHTSDRDPNVAAELRRSAVDVRSAMPIALRSVTAPGPVAVATKVRTAVVGDAAIVTRLVYLGAPDGRPLVRWVQGDAPAASPPPTAGGHGALTARQVQVGMQVDAATALGVHVGDHVRGALPTHGQTDVVVTGLYTVLDAGDDAWLGFDDVVSAQDPPPRSEQQARVALLVTDDSLPDVQLVAPVSSRTTTYRYPTRAAEFDAAAAPRVLADLTRVQGNPEVLRQTDGNPAVSTALGSVLDTVDARLAAARAQQSLVVVGLAGVGALVLVLAARLLVGRRETYLLGERARGASLAAVATRALVESVPAAVIAGLVGAAIVEWTVPGPAGISGIAVCLVLVAMLAPPVISVGRARSAWTGRRQPANRTDRDRTRRLRRTRRLVAEVALVMLAAAAFVSVRRRGLLPSGGSQVDLLLAAAPLLAAAALTVVVVHAIPPLLRAAARLARRGRGLVPLVATARASAVHGAVVPMTALTMAIAMVVFCGTTTVMVRAGQTVAADRRVGADVRVDGPLTQQDVDALRASPGVGAVAGVAAQRSVGLGRGTGAPVDLILVDAEALSTIAAAHGHGHEFAALATHPSTGLVPAVVDTGLVATVRLVPPQVLGAAGPVGLGVVGTVPSDSRLGASVSGSVERARVVVDRATFDAAAQETTPLSSVLVDGPGAAAAVTALHLEKRPDVHVTTRAGWLAGWTATPLNRELVVLLLAAAAVLALYAALALALLVVATSRERGRTLSALRTLGLDVRTGRALTLAELAPIVGAALLAGIAIGLGVPWLLGSALGLDVATGGSHAPPLVIGWWPLLAAGVTVAGALVVAVVVESAARRGDRLGDVLRVGER